MFKKYRTQITVLIVILLGVLFLMLRGKNETDALDSDLYEFSDDENGLNHAPDGSNFGVN